MQDQTGPMSPCYNKKYDNDADGDDSDTAHCKYASNNSNTAAFRRQSCH